MAHYDCNNCGSGMGIDFGYCTDCTPKEYFEIQKKINQLYNDADKAWQVKYDAEMKEAERRFKQDFMAYHGIFDLQCELREIEKKAKQ